MGPDFDAILSTHSYDDDRSLDFTSYAFELTAKYRGLNPANPLDSDTVRWFRHLFSCLKDRGDLSLLLTRNLQSALDRFDPQA